MKIQDKRCKFPYLKYVEPNVTQFSSPDEVCNSELDHLNQGLKINEQSFFIARLSAQYFFGRPHFKDQVITNAMGKQTCSTPAI
ncbi:hypothetical protein PGT21_021877 [Puccinia graminis f. sp. tritici]|uniref:Uncharacterized protein n=1 Tax=Puccinia graminis f. sp. tritici TaxID=56615 RepID=A0A5B0QTZ1_PUCGR|nr:hypothetical protein PGT21_021877 [Puccinia graminis f. sp. tritici]